MPLKFNQSKVILKLLKEKSDFMILGEILHYIWEKLLVVEKNVFFLSPDSEKFKNKIKTYAQKALAFYQDPFPQRKNILEKIHEIMLKIFKSENFKDFKEIIKEETIIVYREPEGFFEEDKVLNQFRPDIIIKKPDEWVVFEFKLHKEFDDTQLQSYLTLLKKIFPDDNIKVYLISFDPFKLELKYFHKVKLNKINEKSSSYPSQLSLFKNLN